MTPEEQRERDQRALQRELNRTRAEHGPFKTEQQWAKEYAELHARHEALTDALMPYTKFSWWVPKRLRREDVANLARLLLANWNGSLEHAEPEDQKRAMARLFDNMLPDDVFLSSSRPFITPNDTHRVLVKFLLDERKK